MSLSTQNKPTALAASQVRLKRIREMCIFAMLGTVMFVSKIVMEVLPNIHLLGVLTMAYTLVYRKKALIPMYIYVLLNGLYAGFNVWWVPYLYIWTVLWGITMLLPKHMPHAVAAVVHPLVCSLHGIAFGALYAPVWALVARMDLPTTLTWIAAGLSFDVLHAVGNFCVGLLVLPLSAVLKRIADR